MNFNQIKFYESALFIFKVKNNVIKHNLNIQLLSDTHHYSTRNHNNIRLAMPSTNYIRYGCVYSAIVNYNNLPMNIKKYF